MKAFSDTHCLLWCPTAPYSAASQSTMQVSEMQITLTHFAYAMPDLACTREVADLLSLSLLPEWFLVALCLVDRPYGQGSRPGA